LTRLNIDSYSTRSLYLRRENHQSLNQGSYGIPNMQEKPVNRPRTRKVFLLTGEVIVPEARAPLPAPEPPVLPTPETRRSTLTATISLGNDVGIRITLAIEEEDDDDVNDVVNE
jgi:hypothetical protein